MGEKFLDLKMRDLLRKFGEGNDIPGSGSAAALQGLLSAQMILNVIRITKKRFAKSYSRNSLKFEEVEKNIVITILPKLEELFEEDSKTFTEVINLRTIRDDQECPLEWEKFNNLANVALEIPTNINFEMTSIFEKLANYGIFICDSAYPAVAGESSVSLNLAISAIRGTISIINLNFKSLAGSSFISEKEKIFDNIKTKLNNFIEEESRIAIALENKARDTNTYRIELYKILSEDYENQILTENKIEEIARNWQNLLWSNNHLIWKQAKPKSNLDLLDPLKSIKTVLGFKTKAISTLGQISLNGKLLEVAAEIDSLRKTLKYSTQFSPEITNFTLAHELGHAILHKNAALHRDIPLNNSESYTSSDIREKEANKFAAFFLMPKNQVRQAFIELFHIEKFEITTDNLFYLKGKEISVFAFKKEYTDRRRLSRLISSTERFGSKSFQSLSSIFGVSQEAMAIRLEELDLVKF